MIWSRSVYTGRVLLVNRGSKMLDFSKKPNLLNVQRTTLTFVTRMNAYDNKIIIFL